jgi:DNA (cytosine-5)-methyltransferase 1
MKYVDLFAGCGGLSLGLEQAGFDLTLAVEKSNMAAETFFHNFVERITDQDEWERFSSSDTPVQEQAKKKVVVKELAAVLECPELLSKLKAEDIDLVAGGPPCQGFSLAGRRNPADVRNKLPWQFLEFVEAVHPKAVVIENVSGMKQDFKKHGQSSPFEQLRIALSETGPGYKVQPVLLNAMHFGAPQHRPRVMLIGLREDVAEALGHEGSDQTWRSEFDHIQSTLFSRRPAVAPKGTHFAEDILTVADAIADLSDDGYIENINISEFAKEMRESIDWMPKRVRASYVKGDLPNHARRRHAPHIETRFRLYQYIRDQGLNAKILNIPKTEGVSENGLRVMVAEALGNTSMPAVSPDGVVLAEDKIDLVTIIMELGTKKHSQRPLKWSAPSPTVVSLPDDYVHPSLPRTLTVRELARFQSFPDAFEFRAKETTGSLRRRFEVPQYTQVGNAVPPKMAKAVGLAVLSALKKARKNASLSQENEAA